MADPRSKPKTPKLKESKAPHIAQQQAKLTNMKATQAPPAQKIMKATGRGR